MWNKQQWQEHWDKHKREYIIGGCCLVVGGAVVAVVLKAPTVMINNAPEMNQINNTIVLPALGDSGDVVQNLRTLETFASKGELARALGVNRARVADYFAGRSPHLMGDQFEVVGKAGHPIQVA